MLIRAILAFLALPTFVAGVFPWLISEIPSPETFRSPFAAAIVMVPGALILIVSVVSFYRRGRGTLAPWDPPQHLVVQDLYRFNRNPMYVGVLFLILGWAMATGSLWNFLYCVLVFLAFHLRVVIHEEKEMQRLFGNAWEMYRNTVPRWWICFRPFAQGVEQDSNSDKPAKEDLRST